MNKIKFPEENKNLDEQEVMKYEFKLNESNFSKFDFLNSLNLFADIFNNFHIDFPEHIRQMYVRYDSKLPYSDYIYLKKKFMNIKEFIDNSYPEWFLDIYIKVKDNYYENNKIFLKSSLKVNSYEDFKIYLQLYRYIRFQEFIPKYKNISFSEDLEIKFRRWIDEVEQEWFSFKEILKNDWTLNDLKIFCKDNQIKIASSMRKHQIVSQILARGFSKWPRNPFVIEILSMDNRTIKHILDLDQELSELSKEKRIKQALEDYDYYDYFELKILFNRGVVLKNLKKFKKREASLNEYYDTDTDDDTVNIKSLEEDITTIVEEDTKLKPVDVVDDIGLIHMIEEEKEEKFPPKVDKKKPRYRKVPKKEFIEILRPDLKGMKNIGPILKKVGDTGELYVLYKILPNELLELYPEGKILQKLNGFILEVDNEIKADIEWVAFDNPSLDHDLRMTWDEEIFYIEVKTTTTSDEGFSISFNELDCAKAHRRNYMLYHIKNLHTPEEEYIKYDDFYKFYLQGTFQRKKIYLKPI